jgi:hypothetical protein
MRKFAIWFPLYCLLTGCVPSIQPLYTDREPPADSELAGTWTEFEGQGKWVVRLGGAGFYEATETEDGETRKFEVHVVRLGSQLFLDIQPGEKLSLKNETFQAHFVKAHTFYRFRRTGDTMKVNALEPEFLKRLVAQRKTTAVQMAEGELVITGSTPEIRELLQTFAGVQEAFTEEGEYRRTR